MKIINMLIKCIFQLANNGSVSHNMKNRRGLKTVDIFVTK